MKKSIIISLFVGVVTLSLPKDADSQTYAGGIQVGEGEYVTFFIDNNGTLTAIGNRGYTGVGGYGSTGNAGASGLPEPVIVSPSNLKFKYAAGHFHGGAAVDVNGRVWTMGTAVAGESGMGNTNYSQYPQKILTDINGNQFDSVVAVVPYAQSSEEDVNRHGWLAVKSTGTLWIWGTPGAMRGDGTEDIDLRITRPARILISGGRSVKQVIGGDYIIALCTDGTVWTWGNTYRNLGYIPAGMEYTSPHQINLSSITQIAGGKQFNYALKSNGDFYGWGRLGNYMNDLTWPDGGGANIIYPQLLPNIQNYLPAPVSKIVTNYSITSALLTDGSLWTWGDNTQGCIGNGESYFGNPTNGYGFDYGIHLLRKIPYNIAPTRTFKNVFAGNTLCFYTYALGTDDQLYAWGTNRGSVIANRINMPITGNLNMYDNSWNRPWPQPVNPFNITSTFISTSPVCLPDASGFPCNTYPIPPNTKPVANAGPNQSVSGASTTLDGTGSTDDVFISYYVWSQVSGPNTAIMDLPGAPAARISGLITGAYVFKLKTIDNGWFSDSAVVQISVNSGGNQPPTANAGNNQTIILPVSSVTLSGSGTDPGGSIASYGWTQVSGTAAIIASPAAALTNITGLTTAGVRVFRLTVTDNEGTTGTSDVTITVDPANLSTPYGGIRKPIPGKLEAEEYDNGGQNTAYFDGTIVNSGGAFRPSESVDVRSCPDAGGGYCIGWTTDGEWVKYSVNVTTTGIYTLTARIGSPNTSKSIQLQVDGVTAGTLTVTNTGGYDNWQTATLNNVQLTAGDHIFRFLFNTGDAGNTNMGFDINWFNFALPNYQPPTASAGPNQAIILPANLADLAGSGTGTGITYAWTQTGGTAATIQSPASSSTTITGLTTAGVRTFRLTVTDNIGAVATSDVTVTVNAAGTSTPYLGIRRPVPGTLQAEEYDNGGQNIAYNDGTPNNIGGAFRPAEAVDIENCTDGGFNTGWTTDGEWVLYSVHVNTTGLYNFTARVATLNAGKSLQLQVDGNPSVTLNVPITGGWQAWQTTAPVNVSLTEGDHVFRFQFTTGNTTEPNSGFNINWFNFALPNYQPPTASAGPNQTITLPANMSNLAGSGTGTGITYAWTQTGGTAATIQSPASSSTSITGLTTAGVRTFRLTVTDNIGATATSDVTITVNPVNSSTPYGGLRRTIPGKLEAEEYDNGGQNTAYFDGTIANSGGAFRPSESVDVRSCPDAGGGYCVGWTTDGEWVKYSVNVTTTGMYSFTARVGTPNTGKSIQFQVDAAAVGTLTVLNTGGFDNWQTVTLNNVALTSGDHTFGFLFNTGDAGNTTNGFDINWFNFDLAPTQSPTANAGSPQAINLPANQVTLTGSGAANNGGTITTYGWTQVSGTAATITNASSASTTVTGLTTSGVRVFCLTVTRNDNQTATSDVTITVNPVNSSTPYGGTRRTIPGKLEAEEYDNGGQNIAYYDGTTDNTGAPFGAFRVSESVDIRSCPDIGGGYCIGWTTDGEWVKYSVNVTITGAYTFTARIATPNTGKSIQFQVDGVTAGTLTVVNTGGFDNWQTVTLNNVAFTSGDHTFRFLFNTGDAGNTTNGFDINWFNFDLVAPPVTATNKLPVNVTAGQQEVIASNLLVSVFPNPTSSYFSLKVQAKSMEPVTIRIVDMSGRMVQQLQVNPGQAIRFGDKIATGTYLIEVWQGKEKVVTKVIKQ